jgi:hypothetical protein
MAVRPQGLGCPCTRQAAILLKLAKSTKNPLVVAGLRPNSNPRLIARLTEALRLWTLSADRNRHMKKERQDGPTPAASSPRPRCGELPNTSGLCSTLRPVAGFTCSSVNAAAELGLLRRCRPPPQLMTLMVAAKANRNLCLPTSPFRERRGGQIRSVRGRLREGRRLDLLRRKLRLSQG